MNCFEYRNYFKLLPRYSKQHRTVYSYYDVFDLFRTMTELSELFMSSPQLYWTVFKLLCAGFELFSSILSVSPSPGSVLNWFQLVLDYFPLLLHVFNRFWFCLKWFLLDWTVVEVLPTVLSFVKQFSTGCSYCELSATVLNFRLTVCAVVICSRTVLNLLKLLQTESELYRIVVNWYWTLTIISELCQTVSTCCELSWTQRKQIKVVSESKSTD